MYLFNLKPENIQVLFLDSLTIKDDPFYDIYKNLISRVGESIYIHNLKQKYHISTAIHVPINWDSTCFLIYNFPKARFSVPNCNKPTMAYKLYDSLIDKFFNIMNFKDSFISDNKIFYYPKPITINILLFHYEYYLGYPEGLTVLTNVIFIQKLININKGINIYLNL